MSSRLAWYFSGTPDAEGRFVVASRGDLYAVPCTLTEEGPVVLGGWGLHASVRALDAIQYASGSDSWIHRVEVDGDVVGVGDKIAGTIRRHLWAAPADDVLRAFARRCALDVAHLWDMPVVVRRYLETGDESLRAAAEAAAKAATRAAAAVGDDAWAAWAAWTAAEAAAAVGDDAWATQADQLDSMLLALAPEGAP